MKADAQNTGTGARSKVKSHLTKIWIEDLSELPQLSSSVKSCKCKSSRSVANIAAVFYAEVLKQTQCQRCVQAVEKARGQLSMLL